LTNEVINVEGMSCDHCKHSIEKAYYIVTLIFNSFFKVVESYLIFIKFNFHIPIRQAFINVEGMSCDHCKHSIEKALNGLDGVTSSEVSLATLKSLKAT
jgi:copper chaperone CopZ